MIEKELGDREGNLDLSDLDMPALLYEVHGMDAAMHYVMDGQQVRIEQKKALRFAELLIEKSKLQAAEKVFNAAEPLDVLNGSTPVESIQSGNLETIYAWVEVAHYFRPLTSSSLLLTSYALIRDIFYKARIQMTGIVPSGETSCWL